MGDRTTTYYSCPKCGKERESYDAPSSLMYFDKCEHCNDVDPRDYYEDTGNRIILCTEEEARKQGLLVECPTCLKECGKVDVVEFKMCHTCYLKSKR